MAIALVTQGSAGANGSFSTASLTTTGATLAVAMVNRYTGGGSGAYSISDNKGNTWTAMTGWTSSGTADTAQAWYSILTSVGASHTVTFTAGSGSPFGAGVVGFFSGTATSSVIDQQVQSSNQASSTTHTAASLTPSTNNQLVVQMLSTDGSNYSSIDSGYSLVDKVDWVGGQKVTAAISYIVQTTATATAPTITISPAGGAGVASASFKEGAGSASQIKTWDGITQANVKEFLGATNAQTKTWDGVSNV